MLRIDNTNPSTPGTPVLSGTETTGVFSVTWTASTDTGSGIDDVGASTQLPRLMCDNRGCSDFTPGTRK